MFSFSSWDSMDDICSSTIYVFIMIYIRTKYVYKLDFDCVLVFIFLYWLSSGQCDYFGLIKKKLKENDKNEI